MVASLFWRLALAALAIAFSVGTAAAALDCAGYAAGAVKQSAEYRQLSCSGGLGEWWSEDAGYHERWCVTLPADSKLPAMGMQDREDVLVVCRASVAPLRKEGPADTPAIRTIDEQILRCRALGSERRDECLVDLALREKDATVCTRTPDTECARLLGTRMMRNCAADYADDEDMRLICELEVAEAVGSAESCAAASQPTGCIAKIAASRRDPRVILGRIDDPEERDRAIVLYANELRDRTALEDIADPLTYDRALAFIVPSIGIGLDRIIDPARYCREMRGGYDADEMDDSRRYCLAAVALSNLAVTRRDAAETQAEKESIGRLIEDISGAVDRGEMTIEEFIAEASRGGGLLD